MSRRGTTLVVNACDPEEVRIALVEGPELVDIRSAQAERGSVVGNLYLGVVRKVEMGLDAAFVDFGDKRAGFLHVGNVHPACLDTALSAVEVANQPSQRGLVEFGDEGEQEAVEDPVLRIDELLQVGRTVLVQVLRDPVRGKGATLTMHLSLAGYCLVWMPSLGRIGVSRRIEDTEERERLRGILRELSEGEELPLIARTAATGQTKRALGHELRRLRAKWNTIQRDFAHAQAPCLALAEEDTAVRACRELFHGGVEEIVCDDEPTTTALQTFLEERGAGDRVLLRQHPSSKPLFEAWGLEGAFQGLFRSRVSLGGGASIVIHETEALTAIDVNSGRSGGTSLEETALATNLLAAREVAHQARLRDLGGILVVDFIDMAESTHRNAVEQSLRNFLREDRARMKTGRLGSFGLMTFTRRRLGTGLARARESMCRGCGGSGSIAHHRAGALRLLRRLRALSEPMQLRIRLHPGVSQQWRRLQASVETLGHQLEIQEDSQTAPGDPIVETLGALAEVEGRR